ncbi:hypothetical protein LPJ70_001012 [Coemansia sp. RSA 2708]|nr:hypothetical protein LPJ70_001012 [Coemansia sp. RSA 2708]
MAETRKQQAQTVATPKETAHSPVIVGSDIDAVASYLELDQAAAVLDESMLGAFSPQLGFAAGALSPAWSLSSSGNDSGGRTPPQPEALFPALGDAGLDGWLQQLVGAGLGQLVADTLAPVQQGIAPQATLALPENASSSVQPVAVARPARQMVPLAPRQQSSTPPGLGVLARTAQNQAPIATQDPAPTSPKTQTQIQAQQRPIAQAHSPNARKEAKPPAPPADAATAKRQERLIKNRAAALLSRKRKREYLTKLESDVDELREANADMARRLAEMERQLGAVVAERDQLRAAAPAAAAATVSATAVSSDKPRAKSEPESKSGSRSETAAESDGDKSGKRQRTAGALLMAVLFSFSLFTLPSLYSGHSPIAAGGVQGVLPPPPEPRLLLLPPSAARPAGSRPAPAAAAQRPEDTDEPRARAANSSSADAHVRPMTMGESAGLHAWIRSGLRADSTPKSAETRPASSLAVVNRRPLDYAMLYCPTMKHVTFSSDAQQVAAAAAQPPVAPRARVLDAPRSSADDVDDTCGAVTSPPVARTGTHDVLVLPTVQTPPPSLLAPQRPKLSLYSPVADAAAAASDILPPWDEYARADRSDLRQKYLRIDVEVVGSKWVTADKFASGLY